MLLHLKHRSTGQKKINVRGTVKRGLTRILKKYQNLNLVLISRLKVCLQCLLPFPLNFCETSNYPPLCPLTLTTLLCYSGYGTLVKTSVSVSSVVSVDEQECADDECGEGVKRRGPIVCQQIHDALVDVL